jgi:hypothetical protein
LLQAPRLGEEGALVLGRRQWEWAASSQVASISMTPDLAFFA